MSFVSLVAPQASEASLSRPFAIAGGPALASGGLK